MGVRFYTNMISQVSRNFAVGLFIVGLLLVGFGFLVYVLRELFAILAAAVFFVVGTACGITAIKIFLIQKKLDKLNSDDSQGYRKNVQIRREEYYDV